MGFADPAESQADDSDAELDAVDDFVEMLMEGVGRCGSDTSGLDELLNLVSRMLTRENSAAAKNAFAATRRRIRSTRSTQRHHCWIILTGILAF